jgi:hypothetical protein
MPKLRRRQFITLLGGAAAWPLAARAQQGDRVRRIGVLMSMVESDPRGLEFITAFAQGLAELGWGRLIVTWNGNECKKNRAKREPPARGGRAERGLRRDSGGELRGRDAHRRHAELVEVFAHIGQRQYREARFDHVGRSGDTSREFPQNSENFFGSCTSHVHDDPPGWHANSIDRSVTAIRAAEPLQ